MDVISRDLVFIGTEFMSQKELFEFISKEVCKADRASNEEEIVKGFYQREEEFSTAMDGKIAIPHCRNGFISQASVVIVRNKNTMEWTDKEQCDLFFALLVPESNENNMHIRILSKVAQLLLDEEFIEKIYQAKTEDEIYSLVESLNKETK